MIKRINALDAHHKLYISLGIMLIVFLATTGRLSSPNHIMVTWLAYAITSLTLAWVTILSAHPNEVKHKAPIQDSSRTLVFLFAVAAAIASLFAIVILLQGNAEKSKQDLAVNIIVPVLCVISSWWLVHTIFTLRYAHFYYSAIEKNEKSKKVQPGGLIFPGEDEPDYLDFTYFSFVLGMTFQVSDVEITGKRIRRLALMHGVLSFAFNTFIVALAINIISGLIQKG